MNRWWLIGAAGVGIAFITAVGLHGERPLGGVVRYEAKGFLAAQTVDGVREVEVEAAGRHRRYTRGADGTWQDASGDLGSALDLAVKLLRDTAPERNISGDELAGARLGGIRLADYGLNPPALVATVRGPKLKEFRVDFGGANPLGQSRYARIDGREIWLVPRHVAEAWEDVARGP